MNSIRPQNAFDAIRRVDLSGNEYWSARELMTALGYAKWQKFMDALERAMAACENSGENTGNHFTRSGKMVEIGSKTKRSVEDYNLTRYACYLTAMNGDPRKKEIADAQMYFAVKTRQAEVMQARPALDMNDPLAVARAFVTAETERRALVATVQELAPKAEVFDTFMDSDALLSVQSAGQLLNMGEKKFFAYLREQGVLMAGGDTHNTPYRPYLEKGYFEVKRTVMTLNSGRVLQTNTTYVTPRGMEFLRRLLNRKPSNRPLPLLAVPA